MSTAQPVVTLQHIAERVGVHKSTVHRALRGDPRVEPGTAARIAEVAAELGYDPEVNQAARRLSLRKSGRRDPSRLVALLFPVAFTQGPYFHRLFDGLVAALGEARWQVLAAVHPGHETRLPPLVARGEADAVVVLHHPHELGLIRTAMAALPGPCRRPLITLMTALDGVPAVVPDFAQAGRLAADHLLDLGHRRLIAIGNQAFGVDVRLAGARAAIAARGLPAGTLVVVDADNRLVGDAARTADALDRLLALAPDATAVLAPNDAAAVQLAGLLAQRGLAVPGRMALIGCDDTHAWPGPDGANRLTTIALPLEDLGAAAARLAMAADGPIASPAPLPVVLRLRGSTGPV